MADANDGWEPVQRIRTYEQVMGQIEERILDGRLKAGDRLPSERELASSLGVSRPSLRESLRVLEALGVVDIRRGGADGGAVLEGSPGGGLVNLLKLEIALAHFSWQEILETRMTLESWSVEEAAYRAEDADLDELAAILDQMDSSDIDSAEFNRLDALFHLRIAQSAGNRLTAHFMGSLRSAIHLQMVEVYAQLEDWRHTAKTVRSEHRAILQAITDRDANGAKQLVRRHIADFYNFNLRDEGASLT
ncbi:MULTISPECIES: FadR/GntR family transcriptional regulator [Leucobacter]|uniref:FadR/GntR family transcriptional regulator n=1 Tax=Leucobacter TaxID=55968 RepID=UPI000A7AEB3B|nr:MULTISPECIES: FadR/GntR family transcriptional regulator [Leucobacter]